MKSVRFAPHWNPKDTTQVVGFLHMVNYVVGRSPAGLHWVEVGGYHGESATMVLGFPQVARLDVVELSQSHAYELTDRFSSHRGVRVYRQSSVEAAAQYLPRSLDVVYIDACHEYDAVLADIDAWYYRVRRGGYICGHDYHEGFPGVILAVDSRFDVEATFLDSSWVHRVP